MRTHATWTTQFNRTAWVLTALSVAAGVLLWYERDRPHYPTTRDEADILAAMAERWLAMSPTNSVEGAFIKFTVTNTVPEMTATNLVGMYASRYFYAQTVPDWFHGLNANIPARGDGVDFVDLWGSSEGYSGAALLYADYPHVTNAWMALENPANLRMMRKGDQGLAWWRSNIFAAAAQYGEFQYSTNTPFYMTTNMLTQIGRPLAAMRWTVGLDASPAWGEVSFQREGTSSLVYAEGFTNPVAAGIMQTLHDEACASLASAPVVWTDGAPADTNRLAYLSVREHYQWARAEEVDGNKVRAIVSEYVDMEPPVVRWPPFGTGLVARADHLSGATRIFAHDRGGYTTNIYYGHLDENRTEILSATVFTLDPAGYDPAATGIVAYGSSLFSWELDGWFPADWTAGAWNWVVGSPVGHPDYPDTVVAVGAGFPYGVFAGWTQTGEGEGDPWNLDDIVIDWAFEFLADPEPVFGTAFGIR